MHIIVYSINWVIQDMHGILLHSSFSSPLKVILFSCGDADSRMEEVNVSGRTSSSSQCHHSLFRR